MSENVVDILREKTGEGDLDSILKSSIGGYTKRSVMEYLAFVKKQQQNLREAYTAEIERIQGEKDELLGEVNALQEREKHAEEAFRQRVEEEKAQVREEYAALEKDMDEALTRIKEDELKLSRSAEELAAEQLKTAQVRQEVDTREARLNTANRTISELEAKLSAKNQELADQQETARILRESLAEDISGQLRDQIQTLMQSVEQLQKEISLRDQELENRAKRIELLTGQERSNHAALEELQSRLTRQMEQNEWAESENEGLAEQLRTQMEQSVSLSRENARLKAANAILQRRLDTEQALQEIASVS